MRHREFLAEFRHFSLDGRQFRCVGSANDRPVNNPATVVMSASFSPRVVKAGVPSRTPEVNFGGRGSL